MIPAVVIDDESHSRSVLSKMLGQYCPLITIIAEAKNVNEGFALINQKKPQLVFLDVKMPEKNGFELLKMFDDIDFEVIFISAFNEYAVTAFEFNALGYVLKPIDSAKLVLAVNKAISKITSSTQSIGLSQIIQTLGPGKNVNQKVVLHHNEKVVFVDIKDVVSVQAANAICEIKLISNHHYYSAKDLKLFEDYFKRSGNFLRISKNTLLNLDYLKSYQKGEICILEMQNGDEFEISRRKKTEILNRLNLD